MTGSLPNDPKGRGRHLPGERLGINGGLRRLGEGLDADPTLFLRRLSTGRLPEKRVASTIRLGLGLLPHVHV